MPQDGRRSVGYRPFVTCGDPKGVVECGTIRKSKSSYLTMGPSSEARLRPKSLNGAVVREELSQASFQLLEVSKGAQKLNHMIESWSKGICVEGQRKDIAKDLLKGALDLQESLMMLGKLQAASKYVARLKRKQEKPENSGLPGDLEIGFHRPEFSPGDEFSRKKIEELREVISSGLARQNRLNKRKSQLQSEIPSTSSSQSSSVNCDRSNDFVPDASSSQSSSVNCDRSNDFVPDAKARAPNIIAKLMGLEHISSRTVQRKFQDKEVLQQQKHGFDIDVLELKKPETIIRDGEPDRRRLKEILDNMQFKGLLKSIPMKETPVFSADDAPPIVLMKPSHEPRHESSEASNPITVLNSLKSQEKFSGRSAAIEEIVCDSERIHETPPVKEIPEIASSQRRGSMHPNVEISTREKARNIARNSNKSRHPSPPAKEHVKREKHGKVSTDTEKTRKSGRKSPEKANSKAKSMQPSELKANSPVTVKPENRPNRTKREISPQRSQYSRQDQKKKETSNLEIQKGKKTVSNQQTLTSSQTCVRKRSPRKKQPVHEPKELTSANVGKDDVCQEEDCIKLDNTCPIDLVKLEPNTVHEDPQFTAENGGAFESRVVALETSGGVDNSPTILNPTTTEFEAAETVGKRLNLEGFGTGHPSKLLLLSSPSFLSHAQNLFTIVSDPPALLQKPDIEDSVSPDERLLADYANELMECRAAHASISYFLVAGLGRLRTHISIDHLLDEILTGIENLSSYCKLASESLLMDGLYEKLKRDLSLHRGGAVSKVWDAGWTKGFCLDDAEHVVDEVEESVLSRLIEDTLMELVQ